MTVPAPFLASLTGGLAAALLGSASLAQHSETRFEYHQHYYDRGHAHAHHVYEPELCYEEPAAGVSLDAGVGGLLGLNADVAAGGGWTRCDRRQMHYAARQAAVHHRTYHWHNPNSGMRGVVEPVRHYERGRQACFTAESETYHPGGRYESGRFEMCQGPDGDWHFSGGYSDGY